MGLVRFLPGLLKISYYLSRENHFKKLVSSTAGVSSIMASKSPPVAQETFATVDEVSYRLCLFIFDCQCECNYFDVDENQAKICKLSRR